MTPPRPSLLARSAGLTGAATLTSRVLGLVRDQVLAAIFGAGNDMDAFIVAFRIPNLVRDLFAEGAMSAAFVPTFTSRLTLNGKDDAWRLGNNVLNALLVVTAVLVALGIVFARPLVTMYAEDYSRVPGKLELTIRLTRMMLPFLSMVAVAAAVMGMLNSLHHYFVPALAPAMFNVATIVCAFVLVPLMPAFGLAADHGHRDRRTAGRGAAGAGAVAAASAGRIPVSLRPRPARAGASSCPHADGARHDRAGRDAGQSVRQHAARHEPGDGRRLVAVVRLPPDVPADRTVRRVHRDSNAAGGVALRWRSATKRPSGERRPRPWR